MNAAEVDTLRSFYDQASTHYDAWAKLFETRSKSRILSRLALKPTDHALDLGVGTGHLFQEIVKQTSEGFACGVDLSKQMLDRARMKLGTIDPSRYRLVEGDVLSYSDQRKYSAVVSTHVIELLKPDQYAAFTESLKRHLKPGARFAVSGMAEGRGVRYFFSRKICRSHPLWNGGFDAQALSKHLKEAGLSVTAIETIDQFTFKTIILFGERPQ